MDNVNRLTQVNQAKTFDDLPLDERKLDTLIARKARTIFPELFGPIDGEAGRGWTVTDDEVLKLLSHDWRTRCAMLVFCDEINEVRAVLRRKI